MTHPLDTSALDTAIWRKASYSSPDNDCVAIARPAAPLDTATWRKASASNPDNLCVAVARPEAPVVGIRDTKAPHAGHLAITPAAFDALLNLARL